MKKVISVVILYILCLKYILSTTENVEENAIYQYVISLTDIEISSIFNNVQENKYLSENSGNMETDTTEKTHYGSFLTNENSKELLELEYSITPRDGKQHLDCRNNLYLQNTFVAENDLHTHVGDDDCKWLSKYITTSESDINPSIFEHIDITLIDKITDDVLLECIEKQAVLVRTEANTFFKKIMRQTIKNRIEKNFEKSQALFERLKKLSGTDLYKSNVDYSILDDKISNLFFDKKYVEEKNQVIIIFSEPKFEKFLLMKTYEIYKCLNVTLGTNDFEMLNVIELSSIQQFYGEFLELVTLESIRYVKKIQQSFIFWYLRALNLLLNYYNENPDLINEFKDKIIRFIDKIFVSETRISCCYFKNDNDMNKLVICSNQHENNYLNIFIYFLDGDVRKDLRNRHVKIKKDSVMFNYLVISCYNLVYGHLLFNKYLFHKNLNEVGVLELINLINGNCECIFCIIENCMSFICEKG